MASNGPAKLKMLTLEEKIKVLRLNNKGTRLGSFAASVVVGSTEVYSIIKNRDLVLLKWSCDHTNSNHKHLKARKQVN